MTQTMAEVQDQAMVSKENIALIIKGKRTKRQRPLSPSLLTLTITSSSSLDGGESIGERENTAEFAESTGEEEDMAKCLILLAQGHQTRKSLEHKMIATNSSKDNVGTGLYAYQCKTCNRCFPSFQALGGHRASHKKPNKANNNEEKKAVLAMEEEEEELNAMSTTLSLHIAKSAVCNSMIKSNKVHECSICGAEFSSGQALGGHMRRHRALLSTSITPSTTTSSPESKDSKKPRHSLQLDLNLPAPEDDIRETKFHFPSKEQVLFFSASSLVDCHY